MGKQLSRAEIASARSVAKTLRVSRRSILFFLRTIITAVIVALVLAGAFVSTARISNTYILINEGMSLRAASMLGRIDDPDLYMYFTADALQNDAALRAQSIAPYNDFVITGYEYDLEVEKLHVFPWQSSIYAEVIEQITAIKGVSSSDGSAAVPAWTPIRYRLRFAYLEGRWYISAIELVAVNPTLPVPNTPDLRQSPIPMATPVPTVTPIPVSVS